MNIKNLTCAVVMEVLYRAIRTLAKHDYRIMKELAAIEQGCVVSIAASPDSKAPRLTVKIENGTIKRVKADSYTAEIIFKSIDSSFVVFTGRMSVAQAYARHAFYLRGSINTAMGVVRAVDITESCLFPKFITKRILTRVYKREFPMLFTYLLLPFNG